MHPILVPLPDGHVELSTGRVVRGGTVVTLTNMERKALSWLVEHAGETVTTEELLGQVWEYAPGVVSRAPYFTVRRLRAKLNGDAASSSFIASVPGEGYRWIARPEPIRAPALVHSNLPALRPLVGRDSMVADALSLLAGAGWLSFYGPPGVGKTALSICVAHTSGREAWRCDAENITDLDGIARALAELLGRRPDMDDSEFILEAVLRMLAARGNAILVLDALRPALVDALHDEWHRHAPALWVITTHRRRPVRHEAWVVPALEPEAGARLLKRLVPSAAHDEAGLQALSASLDGLPLALELVSPRLRILSASKLAKRPGRLSNMALNDLVASSWDALDANLRTLLHACAAFDGGATFEDLCAVSALEESLALDSLEALCDQSLVQCVVDPTSAESRFRVFSVIRMFVSAQVNHAEYCRRQAHHTTAVCRVIVEEGPDGALGGFTRLVLESRNLETCLGNAEVELEARLARDSLLAAGVAPAVRTRNASCAVVLARARQDDSLLIEALLLFADSISLSSDDGIPALEEAWGLVSRDAQRGRVALAHGRHLLGRGRCLEATEHLQTALNCVPAHVDPVFRHEVLQGCLFSAFARGDTAEARQRAEAILVLRHAFALEMLPHRNLVNWYDMCGNHDAMSDALETDVKAYARRGESDHTANAWMNIGYVRMHQLDPDAAPAFERAISVARRSGQRRIEATVRYNLSCFYLNQGLLSEGMLEVKAARVLANAIQHPRIKALCALGLTHLQVALCHPGALDTARETLALSEACDDQQTWSLAALLYPVLLHEAGQPEEARARWTSIEARVTQGPPAQRLSAAYDCHHALYALVCGNPEPLDVILAEKPDSIPRRMLTAWSLGRR